MKLRNAMLMAIACSVALFLSASFPAADAEATQSWRGLELLFEGVEATQDNPWGFTAGLITTEAEGRCVLLTPKTGVTIAGIGDRELELNMRIHPWVSEISDGAALKVIYLDARENTVSEGTLSIESDQRLEYIIDMDMHPKATHVRLMVTDWANHGVDNDWIVIDSPPVETKPEDWQELQVSFLNAEPTDGNPWGFMAGIIDTDEDGQCLLLTPRTGAVLRIPPGSGAVKLFMRLHPWVAEKSDGAQLKIIYLDTLEKPVAEKDMVLAKGQKLEYSVDLARYPGATHLKLLCDSDESDDTEGDWIMIGLPVPETEPEDWQGIQASFMNVKPTEDNPWSTTAGIIDTDEDGRCLLLTPGTGAMLRELDDESAVRLSMRLHPWVAEKSDGAGLKVAYLDEQDEVVAEDELTLEKDQEIQYDVDLAQHPGATHIRMLCNSGKTQDTEGDWIMIGLLAMETEPEDWQGIQTSFMNAKPTEDNPWGATAGIIDTDEDGRCLLLTPGTGAMLRELDDESAVRLSMRLHPWVAEKSDGAGLKVAYLDEQDEIVAEDELTLEKDQKIQYDVDLTQHPGTTHIRMLCNSGKTQDTEGDWIMIGLLAMETEPEDWQGIQTSFINAKSTEDNPWGYTAGIIDTDEDGRCLLLTPGTGSMLRELDDESAVRLSMRLHPWVAEKSDGAGLKVAYLDEQDEVVAEDELTLEKDQEIQYDVDLSQHPGAKQVRMLCNSGKKQNSDGDWVVISVIQITKGETPEAQAEQEDWNGLQTSFLNPARTEDNPWGTTAGIIDTDEDGRCLLLTPNTGAVLKIPEGMHEIRLGMRIHPWVAEHSDGAGVLVWLLDAGDNILHEENIPVGNTADYFHYQQDLTAFPGTTHMALRCNNGANGDDSGDWVVVRLEP